MTKRTWALVSWIWLCIPVVVIFFCAISILLRPWWSHMDDSAQAAWIQAIGAIVAIFVAVLIPYWQRWRDYESNKSNDRKIVMSAATNLAVALDYASLHLDFAPAGDGVIGHDFTLEQARDFMKLEIEAREAIQKAIDKAHYFDEHLCEQIVLLSIFAAAYERTIDELARHTQGGKVDLFFKNARGAKEKLSVRINEVRSLLKVYLPKTA